MKSSTLISLILIGLGLTAVSCGVYTFNPKGKSALTSIAVERFENKTPEFGLADRMTDDVIDAFIAEGSMKIVAEENAEAILSGTLVSYVRLPLEYTETDEVISYAVTMGFDIVLKNSDDGSEIWKERVSQQGIYQVDVETEEDGVQMAIGLLVEAIINKTTKSW